MLRTKSHGSPKQLTTNPPTSRFTSYEERPWVSDEDYGQLRGSQLMSHPLCELKLLFVEPGLDELDRGEPAVRAVRPVQVVVDPPVLGENLGLEQ